MSYSKFAVYYDLLTYNVNYNRIANFILNILKEENHNPGLTLDLACGTGKLTVELSKRGLEMIGVDASDEMLSIAQQKASMSNANILFLKQKMQNLDLYGTIDTAICSLDSINHLTNFNDVITTIKKISLFLNKNGYFIFDLNTIYKHRKILGNNTFVYDLDNLYCVWQNSLDVESNIVRMNLEFFERVDHIYYRSTDKLMERAYEQRKIENLLICSNLKIIGKYDEAEFTYPTDETQRIIYITKKF